MGSTQIHPSPVRFGVFEADLLAGELRRNGIKVRLQDLPFRMLTILLARSGEVVTREELRLALWPPDVFVDFEQGISSAVMRLRDALRDSADNPIFIETIERRGYRWIGPIHPLERVSKESQEQETVPVVVSPAEVPAPSTSSYGRPLVLAVLVVLALVMVLWKFRHDDRGAEAGARSGTGLPRKPHSPPNHEAEEFYLKGRFYWNKRTPESLNLAQEAFTQALTRDPNYSDAYVGLADCYNLQREFSAMPPDEAYFRAFTAARKAVELNDQSAAAHASLAFVTFWGMWDTRDAEKEFRRAIELDPNNAKAHHWFATSLQAVGRHQEALAEIETARKLDPHSSAILADEGQLLESAGRHAEAIQVLTQLEAAEPDFLSPHRYLRFSYFNTGNYPGYIAEFRKESELLHDPATTAQANAASKGFARAGERGLLEDLLKEQIELSQQGKLSPFLVAQTEAKLGNFDEAVQYLTKCVWLHDENMIALSQNQGFKPLHGNPAFEKLVAIVGISPTS
ncbi:MAG: tetratricopeptide repeat protein [Candidatus Sulfotelmatobacter sp.]|jgi:DNA-binding winged helix-turn-helix (wHTH) protein/Tfp pilus assembly protein PilF